MKILFLAPYPPYPPFGGGTMRIYQLLRGLAPQHELTCLTFAADAAAEAALAPLRAICRVVTVRGPEQRSARQRAWTTLTSPLPDMALRNLSESYSIALRLLLEETQFDVIQAESIEMAQYLQVVAAIQPGAIRVLDQFNAEYVLQQRAATTSLRALLRWQTWLQPRAVVRNLAGVVYSGLQWQKLRRFERSVVRSADTTLAVSDDDRQILQRLAPLARLAVVPNGVDSAAFSRQQDFAALGLGTAAIVFSGTLDFRPNIDAVTWFVQEVWPAIIARRPDARFLVVGRRPPPALTQLVAPGLTIVGEVPDARPWIAGAAVYVVPMRIGGGVRLKLLEALSLEAPVVSTAMGAEGIRHLQNATQCLLADEPAAFAEAVLQLLADPEQGRRLGSAGRELVSQAYDWKVIVPHLEAIYAQIRHR